MLVAGNAKAGNCADVTAAKTDVVATPAALKPSKPAVSPWVRPDSYRLDAFDQVQGVWPIGQPLPLPKWSNKQKKTLVVEKVLNLRIPQIGNFN